MAKVFLVEKEEFNGGPKSYAAIYRRFGWTLSKTIATKFNDIATANKYIDSLKAFDSLWPLSRQTYSVVPYE